MARSVIFDDELLRDVPACQGYRALSNILLYQRIGEGNMAVVYLGRHLLLDEDRAVKVLCPGEHWHTTREDESFCVESFLKEAKAACDLRNDNLVRFYDVKYEYGLLYIETDYIDGESALRRLERRRRDQGADQGGLEEQETVEIALGAANALAAAHEAGLLHRDVKPHNIMISRQGDVFLTDLGLVTAYRRRNPSLPAADGSGSAAPEGRGGRAFGTFAYMSPEQWDPDREEGPQADVWSLGVTIYQLLTGTLPFAGSDWIALQQDISEATLPYVKRRRAGTSGSPPAGPSPRRAYSAEAAASAAKAGSGFGRAGGGSAGGPTEGRADISDGIAHIVSTALQKDPGDRFRDGAEMAAALREHLGRIRTSGGSSLAESPAGEMTQRVPPGASTIARARDELALTAPPLSRDAPPEDETPRSRSGAAVLVVASALIVSAGLAAVGLYAAGRGPFRPGEPGGGERKAAAKAPAEKGQGGQAPADRAPAGGDPSGSGPEGAGGGSPGAAPGEASAGRAPAPTSPLVVDLGGVRLELVYVKPGRFRMGSRSGSADERPVRHVEISRGFHIGRYEVTQEQYEKVMGANPSRSEGPDGPVEMVSWEDASAFCEALSRLPVGRGGAAGRRFRLPTEAEWEYACRAGSAGDFSFGDDEELLAENAWYWESSGRRANPAGGKPPNAFGLHDMHGNVWEWCSDWYDAGYYARGASRDPKGPAAGRKRVQRGGSWMSNARSCRAANRSADVPSARSPDVGFRVVSVPAGLRAPAGR